MAKSQLHIVEPDLTELLPTAGARAAFEDASAAIEAGILVKKLRKTAGLTQIGLAERLGVSQARVSAIEKGEGRDGPSYALLKRIATACKAEWPLRTPAGAVAATSPVRKFRMRRRLPVLTPLIAHEMVPFETPPGGGHSKQKGMVVLDEAGRKVGEVVQVIVSPRHGATTVVEGVHYDRDKAAFVSDTRSILKEPGRSARKP